MTINKQLKATGEWSRGQDAGILGAANDNNPRPRTYDRAVMAYLPAIKKRCGQMEPGHGDALLGDVLIHLFSKWHLYRSTDYGRGSGFHNFLMWQIRGVRRRRAERSSAIKRVGTEISVDPFRMRAVSRGVGQHTPPAQLDNLELQEALALLDDRNGGIVLRRAAGESQREIAASLGVSSQAIQQREYDAQKRLAKALAA